MNLTKKLLGAVLMSTAALSAAEVAHASTGDGFTPSEIAYLSDVAADGMGPAVSAQGLVDEGWTICHALRSGMSADAAAGKVYAGSRSAEGTDGVTRVQAVRVVDHAMGDLCPSGTPGVDVAA